MKAREGKEQHKRERLRVAIQHVRRIDVPSVVSIEEACAGWDAWSHEDFLVQLRQHGVMLKVAEAQGAHQRCGVVGFLVYRLCREHVEVLRLAVHPHHWRQGVGRQLAEHLQDKVGPDRRRARIEVRVPFRGGDDIGGLLFLRALGFRGRAVGEAVVMEFQH